MIGLPLLSLSAVPILNTIVLITSSAMLERATHAVRRGELRRTERLLGVAFGLAVAFAALQVELWSDLFAVGKSAPRSFLLLGLGWLHALQVTVGLVAILWLTLRARRRAYWTLRHGALRVWSLYWHSVALAWIAMLIGMFEF